MGTFSTNLLLSILAFGESAANGFDNWGDSANANFNRIDSKFGSKATFSLAAGDLTLSATDEAKLFLEFTGTLAEARTVNLSVRPGYWFISNQVAGGFAVSLLPSGGTALVIPAGVSVVYSDGDEPLIVQSAGESQAAQIIYEASAISISTGSPLVIAIPSGTATIEIECEVTSISSNPGAGLAQLLVDVSDGVSWSSNGTAGVATWSNNGTGNRRGFTTLKNMDDPDLGVFIQSNAHSSGQTLTTATFVEPSSLSGRPITAMRLKPVPSGGSITASIARLRVTATSA